MDLTLCISYGKCLFRHGDENNAIEEGFQTVTSSSRVQSIPLSWNVCFWWLPLLLHILRSRVTTLGAETGYADCGFSSFAQPLTCRVSPRPLLCNSQFAMIPVSDTTQTWVTAFSYAALHYVCLYRPLDEVSVGEVLNSQCNGNAVVFLSVS